MVQGMSYPINQELEKTLQELQRSVREKELANGQLNDALRSALDAKQKAEMDREVRETNDAMNYWQIMLHRGCSMM